MYALEPGDDLTRTRPVVSADNRLVAAGDWSGKVIVWDLENDKITAHLSGGGEGSRIMAVTALPASPATLNNSDWFAEASSDGTVRLWDPDEQDAPQRTLGWKGESPVRAVGVSPDGANLVSVSENQKVQVWRLSDGMRIQELDGPPSTNADVAFSRDGELLAVSAADRTVHIWHWVNGHKLAVLHRHGDSVNTAQFTDDGSLVTASDDSTVAMFPCTTCGPFEKDLLKQAQERVEAHRR